MKKSEVKQIIKEWVLENKEILKEEAPVLDSYMFFQNLKTIKNCVEQMLEIDHRLIDNVLNDGHNWAEDHIATSKDDIEEVFNFLASKKIPMKVGEELKGGQKKLDVAEPKGKITKADFDALRAKKKKK